MEKDTCDTYKKTQLVADNERANMFSFIRCCIMEACLGKNIVLMKSNDAPIKICELL